MWSSVWSFLLSVLTSTVNFLLNFNILGTSFSLGDIFILFFYFNLLLTLYHRLTKIDRKPKND